MRRLPPWLWLMLALVFGTAATFMAMGWLKSQSQKVAKQSVVPLVEVVVTAKDVPPAVALSEDLLRVRRWPQDTVPPGSFRRLEDAVGRVTAIPLAAGEPLLENKLAPKGVVPGLTALLSPEKRAMTVKVDEASGVAGFLNPDNRVDVVVTVDKGDFNKDPISKVVLQNIRVLGTGQRIEKKVGEKPQVVPTVTLEVTPEEGARLALAVQEGKIFLILRHQQDEMLVRAAEVRASTLLGNATANPGNARMAQATTNNGPQVIRGPFRPRKGTQWGNPVPAKFSCGTSAQTQEGDEAQSTGLSPKNDVAKAEQ